MVHFRVELTEDFLETLVKDPATGLVELIDNALDADANNIEVSIARNDLGGIETITVADDGTGMSPEQAQNLFRPLGGSSKRHDKVGPQGRARRGRRGKGRFAAFAIGDHVVWASTTGANDHRQQVTITGNGQDMEVWALDGPHDTDNPVGTIVTVARATDRAQTVESQSTRSKLEQIYAPYLERQQSLTMILDERPLDAARQYAAVVSVPLNYSPGVAGGPDSVRIVEWSAKVTGAKASLVLRDGDGDALQEFTDLPPSSVRYTAYLDWAGFDEHAAALPLAENAPEPIGPIIETALTAIANWRAHRHKQARSEFVERWKTERSYPYTTPPATLLDEAERDMFDLVATTAGPTLAAGDATSRRLSLTLIREALRRDPSELTHVLTQILNLAPNELGDLNALLQRTSLSRVIATAHQVVHRLEVLTTLDDLTTERRPVPGTLERGVHEIAAAEPWLFGDEYALALSERGLTAVLKWHRSLLDNPIVIDDSDELVKIEGGIARVDLLLARTIENDTNSLERLVVELKRPGLELSATETTQIKKYAFALAGDRRFAGQDIRWDFLLIGSSIDEFVQKDSDPRTGLIHNRDNIRVRVSTWDSLLRTRRHRLAFLNRELQLAAKGGTALAQLREVRSHDLPPVGSPSA